MANQIWIFLLRWALSTLGLWISVQLFGDVTTSNTGAIVAAFLLAGLIFSAINSIIKPILTILSLPFLLVTLGLFMLIINGFLVWLAVAITPTLEMSFGWAIVSGIILSLVNYIVSGVQATSNQKELEK